LSAAAAKDARAVRTREALQDALLQLLQEKPFDQVTVRDIAARAEINYATFFRHHATKESLLHDIAAEQVRKLAALMLPSLDISNIGAAALALCHHVESNRALWSTLLTGGAANILREELLTIARASAESRSDPNAWVPAELAISCHVSGTIEVLTWWLRQRQPERAERVAQLLEHIVLQPINIANRKFAKAGPPVRARGKRARR
jgi:AcrR family transcriptional regulator